MFVNNSLFNATLNSGTVTTHAGEVIFVPSVEVAVIFAVPCATAVTTPDELTVAILVLLEDHVTVLFVAFEGIIVAVKVSV